MWEGKDRDRRSSPIPIKTPKKFCKNFESLQQGDMEFLGSPVLTNFLLGIVVLLLVLIAWLTNILTGKFWRTRGV